MVKVKRNHLWNETIREHLNVIEQLVEDGQLLSDLSKVGHIMGKAYRSGCKVLLCGNGGSAADAQHIAAELAGRFSMERKALDADALHANTSSVTAIGNDYGYDHVFTRLIEGKGKEGDVLVAISTSGNSTNVINAIIKAKSMGITTVGLIGGNRKCKIYEAADYCICVPSTDTARIQEAHILMGHMLCEFIEKELFGI